MLLPRDDDRVEDVPGSRTDGTDRLTIRLMRSAADVLACDLSDAELLAGALELAGAALPDVHWASLTRRPRHGRASTPAATDPVAEAADAAQFRTGQGPCLEAVDTGRVVCTDLTDESRWPQFVDAALAGTPVRGVLSHPLCAAGHDDVSLNLYTAHPGSFDCGDLPAAALAAAGVALVLSGVAHRCRARNLDLALTSNRRIGAAVGVLMARRKWRYEEAFDALRRASQDRQRKLRDVAEDVLFTGALDPIG
jgi:hypothetical protein